MVTPSKACRQRSSASFRKPAHLVPFGKVAIVARVPKELIGQGLKAGDWVREVAKVTGGGGGGRPDMAQAGGKDPAKLPEALQWAVQFANQQLD